MYSGLLEDLEHLGLFKILDKRFVHAKNLKRFIRKKKKEHREETDPDDFPICPIEEQENTTVAPKGEYLGTEQERKKAIKDLKEMDKLSCSFCSFCDDLMKRL